MNRTRDVAVWLALGAVGAVLTAILLPQLFPALPDRWSISREEAVDIALENLRDLGEPVEDPYLVARWSTNQVLEGRLQDAGDERLWDGWLSRRVFEWEVLVYERDARSREWTYRAEIGPDGEVRWLERRPGRDEGTGVLDDAEARRQADAFLAERGLNAGALGEPTIRREDLDVRTDTVVRYPVEEPELDTGALGDDVSYGYEVVFTGDRLAGFRSVFDDPQWEATQARLRGATILGTARFTANFLIFPIVAFFFLRRYHAGEVGVRRAAQIFGIVFACGVLAVALISRSATEGFNFGPLTRPQNTWIWTVQMVMLFVASLSAISFLSWSVGEARCRERWGHKLAAFDALLMRRWGNATFARAAVRGLAAGAVLAGAEIVLALALRPLGADPSAAQLFGPWWESARWPGVVLLLLAVLFTFYGELFGRLLLVTAAVRKLGRWAGAAVAAVAGGFLFGPDLRYQSVTWDLIFGTLVALALVGLFLRYDLMTAIGAAATGFVLPRSLVCLMSDDPGLQLQGGIALLGVALPALASVRWLIGGEELVYRYEDVPPHVRRIAERERQRVELETARRIQSSILPELPPSLQGVEIAHAYLPASEVGGDFYDVLALEDGRLALAVGDVAGHGVSSGLVMSMARSALAVQVTFDAEVGSVFRTMNRMVYQTARKRLLTTLSYAVLDPNRLLIDYGSAGHLFPYRISASGHVDTFESVAYPLGVRDPLAVTVRSARLTAGDTLFFYSDGVVEARREDSDEQFGFERLEDSLRRHAAAGVRSIQEGVLADIERFTRGAPREDDQTILVLRLPSVA